MERVFDHPQTEARDMVTQVDLPAPASGQVKLLGPAIKFGESKATIRSAPPSHREHTNEFLRAMGIRDLDELEKDGVVRNRSPV